MKAGFHLLFCSDPFLLVTKQIFFCRDNLHHIQQMLKITVRKNSIFNPCLKLKFFSYAIIVAY